MMLPRPPGPGGFARRQDAKPVPLLDAGKHPDAVYVLDAGVGFAFAHVNELAMLAEHYGTQMAYTDVVAAEWRTRANWSHASGVPGETSAEREVRERNNALREAGKRLVRDAKGLFGAPAALGLEHSTALGALHAELVRIQGPGERDDVKHWGECNSVRHGEMLMSSGVEVVVLCANDHGARQLAKNHGLACRTMKTVLTEMVHSDELSLTETDADALFKRLCEVTRVPMAENYS
jgi:hypothetical protein